MKKYIKWFLLSILIIAILITIILFRNFVDENNNNNLNNDNVIDNEKSILDSFYDKRLYFINMVISDSSGEILRIDYNDGKYIIINNQTIEYCYSSEEECKVDNYVYGNDNISISTYNTLGPGNYKIEVLDEMLKLSRNEKDKIISYYFEDSKG